MTWRCKSHFRYSFWFHLSFLLFKINQCVCYRAPAVRLNISMRSMRPLSRLYITFKCLRHDSNDLRCNSSTGSPVVCRSFNFLTDERFGIADMILPLLMQYKCFNVDSYGHFQVNITLLPDQCRLRRLATRYWLPSLASLMLLHRGPFRSTYFISVPDLTKLVPEYDEWTLQGKEGSQQHNLTERARSWAPFLFVDPYSSPGAIAIRIASPPHSLAPFISNLSINVSARTGAGHKSYELHSTHVISLPNATGVFVSDLVAGDYSASCQVLWPNCSTQSPCPITSIGFWLDRDIRLPHQTPPPWIRNAALILLIFITGKCLSLIFLLSCLLSLHYAINCCFFSSLIGYWYYICCGQGGNVPFALCSGDLANELSLASYSTSIVQWRFWWTHQLRPITQPLFVDVGQLPCSHRSQLYYQYRYSTVYCFLFGLTHCWYCHSLIIINFN